jgi:hypothetical protein
MVSLDDAEQSEQDREQASIKVYKTTWIGWRLVGWIDANGTTYGVSYSNEPRAIRWEIDRRHRVFIRHGNLRGLVGHVEDTGWVYAEYGRPYGSYGTGRGGAGIPHGFEAEYLFQLTPEGEVYEQALLGVRLLGRVEGAPDIYTIGALALLMLM